ncbi:unnamed protein product [Prunus armeniaca]|uniref:Uncharacterized protein n=1 Tax=Prunus armeniaca TaxID=36596 RepID=A0A6J5WPC6_PRUAR|nr:unnamed protein product [Prunus armeniaca]
MHLHELRPHVIVLQGYGNSGMERRIVKLNNDGSSIRSGNRFVILDHRKKLGVSRRMKTGGDAEWLGSTPRSRVA